MDQRLTLYRRHSKACIHSYPVDLRIVENDRRADCCCGIVASGRLSNEERRVLHRATGAADWPEARKIRDQWLAWGATVDPSSIAFADDARITVKQAVEHFTLHSQRTAQMGNSTTEKYRVFLNNRLLMWCKARGIRLIAEFEDKQNVLAFFYSWRSLQPVRGKALKEAHPFVELKTTTKRAELERYRTFLRFCQSNGWVRTNYSLRPHIRLTNPHTTKKVAWTLDEYSRIEQFFREWPDERGNIGNPKAVMQYAFAMMLRYSGQRISDVAMLGPDNIVSSDGNYFLEVQQIKTGQHVKIPLLAREVTMLRRLPLRGTTAAPFVYRSNNRLIRYGTEFWFWTGTSDVEGNAKNWSDDINRVLKRYQSVKGKFAHPATAHTFRHFFAIQMLTDGVRIETVSRWLGHSSPLVTMRHYGHANADMHAASHQEYERAMQALARREKKVRGKVVAIKKRIG